MREEILGRDEILGRCGREEILGRCGREEILGAFVGDDERELARDGGACEKGALRRRLTTSGYNGAWARIRGEEEKRVAREALEELQERAKAGDERAKRALDRLKSKSSGDAAAPPSAAFTSKVPSLADAKLKAALAYYRSNKKLDPKTSSLVGFLRRCKAGSKKDQAGYAALQDRAKAGDPSAMDSWADVVVAVQLEKITSGRSSLEG